MSARDQRLVELRVAGLSLRQLACADGRSVQTIRRVLARAGLSGPLTPEQRFWAKVDKTATCWLWQGAKDSGGYGQIRAGRQEKAHRLAYQWLVGAIPEGLQLDHLCRVRNCVNPDHLEPVTPRENTMRSPVSPSAVNARKARCSAGHELGGDNRFPGEGSGRACRTCQQARQSARVTCDACGMSLRADTYRRHMQRRHDERGRS